MFLASIGLCIDFFPATRRIKTNMIAEEKLVKEYHVSIEALPGMTFKVRADNYEKAIKTLIGELRAAIAELQKHKGQNKPNQSTV